MGEAKQLQFDTGVITYNINGKVELSFNPADVSFIERLYGVVEELDRKQEKYKKTVEEAKDTKEVFEISRKIDGEMREALDGVFNQPVCGALFDGMSIYAVSTETGLPVWVNFILAILDESDASMTGAEGRARDRLKKYTSKYHR
ncbi:MAG: hypothetical protein HFF09_06540 [Oscillospiraceae bacterium]|nr:hypothetical protein [Oscillospiraceae bacterium]